MSLERDEAHRIEVYPLNAELHASCWRWGKEKARAAIDNDPSRSNVVAKQVASGKWNVYEKSRLSTQKVKSVWTETEMRTEDGTRQTNALFPEATGIFDHPKSVELIRRCIQLVVEDSDTILDFFSGSATTAHAAMLQELHSNMHIHYILCQIPQECAEGTVARSNGYQNICLLAEERIRRAGAKIAAEVEETNRQLKLGEEPKPIPDIGFRVLSIDDPALSNTRMRPADWKPETLDDFVDNSVSGATSLDLLFQVLPAFRIPYSAKIDKCEVLGRTVYYVEGRQLIACFDDDISTEVIEEVAKERPLYAVFRDSCFANDAAIANLEELFRTFSPDTVRRVI